MAHWVTRRFGPLVGLMCAVYLIVELAYIARLPLVMDEFSGAYDVLRLKTDLPYRDFKPYKTVLGYYIQLLPLLFTHDLWTGMLAIKVEMAVLNTIVLFYAARSLADHYAKPAVCLSLGLLVVMSTFLERSTALRVDMLTSVFGLISLLLLMKGRCAGAGVAVAMSFLISQKAVFYVLAGGAALGVHFLVFERTRARARDLVAYPAAAFLVLVAYLGMWASLSTFDAVIGATFFSHHEIAFTDLYDLNHYWRQTISRNSFFYAAGAYSAIALLLLTLKGARSRTNNVLLVFALVLTVLCVWHRQPWPYFFVILIPTVFVLTVPGFEHLLTAPEFRRPFIRASLTAGYVLLGIAHPLLRVPIVLARDNAFQRHMVHLADSIVQPGETYLAGVDILYDRTDVPTALIRLDRARLRRLGVMKESELNAVIADLEAAPVKLLVNNYRLDRLPPALDNYLRRHYCPLWGNLEIYAPRIEPSQRRFRVRFDGTYVVEIEGGGVGRVNGQAVRSGMRVALQRGEQVNESQVAFRLRFAPEGIDGRAKPEFRQARTLFAHVYDY